MKKLSKNKVTVNNANLYAAEYYEVYCVRGTLDHLCGYRYVSNKGWSGLKSDVAIGRIYTSSRGYCPICYENTYECCKTNKYDPRNDLECHLYHAPYINRR